MASLLCHYHPSAHLIEDPRAGDIICPECGLVVGDRIIDVGTEWRSFADERSGNDPSRVGAPENPIFGTNDLSTNIMVGFGASESSKGLANAQRRNVNHERQLYEAVATIREMSERINLNLPIQNSASKAFKQIFDSKVLRGRNKEALAAACLHYACRKENVARTFKEIAAVSNASAKDISRCSKAILEIIPLHVEQTTSTDYMSRFCGNLNLPLYVQAAATRIAEKAVELDLVLGRMLASITGAAIYMASQASSEKRDANEIGVMVGAAESTVKRVYKEMLPKAKELFPPDFIFDTPIEYLPTR